MIICHCHKLTDKDIKEEIKKGAKNCKDLQKCCKACSDCKGCAPAVKKIVEEIKEK